MRRPNKSDKIYWYNEGASFARTQWDFDTNKFINFLIKEYGITVNNTDDGQQSVSPRSR